MSELRLVPYRGGSLVKVLNLPTSGSDNPLTPDEQLILELVDERDGLRRQRDDAVAVCKRLARLPTAASLLAYRLIVEETPGFIVELRGIAKAAACIKGEQK